MILSRKRTVNLFLLCATLAGTTSLYAQHASHKGLKKGVNLAVNFTDKRKAPPQTYLNLGLVSNYSCLTGLGVNVISSINHYHAKGLQLAGITNVTGLDVAGIQIAGIANVTGRSSGGVVLSGLMNVSGKTSGGLIISGLGNVAGKNMFGLSIGGMINISNKNISGVGIAGLANIAGENQRGVMISGLMNVAGKTSQAVQITSLLNIAAQSNNGLQLAALGNVSVINQGMQLAISNYASENKGLQMGIANIAASGHRSLQFGLVNISGDSCAHQIGCVNITPNTRAQLIISSGNLNKINLAARFKNQHTYTELGGGVFYLDPSAKFSLSAFYRAGIYVPIFHRLELSADIGFHHIETFQNKHKGYPARMYALHPRVNLEYRVGKQIGIFASGGYSWTRQYGHNHTVEQKPTIEAGIVIF